MVFYPGTARKHPVPPLRSGTRQRAVESTASRESYSGHGPETKCVSFRRAGQKQEARFGLSPWLLFVVPSHRYYLSFSVPWISIITLNSAENYLRLSMKPAYGSSAHLVYVREGACWLMLMLYTTSSIINVVQTVSSMCNNNELVVPWIDVVYVQVVQACDSTQLTRICDVSGTRAGRLV